MFHQSLTNTLIVLIIMNNCHYQNLVFYNIKKIKNSKCCKPKIIVFKNNNKHTNFEIWSNFFLYSPFWNSKKSQFGTNVTLHDVYCQQHDGILKIKSIFNYKMLYPNINLMDVSIDSKSKPSHDQGNIWKNNIVYEIKDSHYALHITNTINIKKIWFTI